MVWEPSHDLVAISMFFSATTRIWIDSNRVFTAERLVARERWPDVKSAMRRASVIRDALRLLGWTDPEPA
jgi:hypothetical protein